MNTAEAARHLNISVCRVWQLIHTGRLQAHKVGRVWDIDAVSVQDYQRTRTRGRPAGRGQVYGGKSLRARRNKVRFWREEGKSAAYIAEHLGVGVGTVRRDLEVLK